MGVRWLSGEGVGATGGEPWNLIGSQVPTLFSLALNYVNFNKKSFKIL